MELAAEVEKNPMTTSKNQITGTHFETTIQQSSTTQTDVADQPMVTRSEVESLNNYSGLEVSNTADVKSNELIGLTTESIVMSISATNEEINTEDVVGTTSNSLPLVLTANESISENSMERPLKRQKVNEVLSEIDGSVQSNTEATSTSLVVPSVPTPIITNTNKPLVSSSSTNNNISSPPTITSTTQLLLPDYVTVRQTVKDLLALLQLYGPLTANQLEYNLPPVVHTTTSLSWTVHEVLSILVAIGLVQYVAKTNQYCMFGGIPRATAIYPTDIPSEIHQTIHEAEDSYKRCRTLRDVLRSNIDNGNKQATKNYKDVLKQLLHDYPQIINDPVYYTALRNFHVDIGVGCNNLTSEKRSTAGTSKSSVSSTSHSSNRGAKSSNRGSNSKVTSKTKETATTTSGTSTNKKAPKVSSSFSVATTVAITNSNNSANSIEKVTTSVVANLSLPTVIVSTELLSNQPKEEIGFDTTTTSVSTGPIRTTTVSSISTTSNTDVNTTSMSTTTNVPVPAPAHAEPSIS
jgi:hypothetical protein